MRQVITQLKRQWRQHYLLCIFMLLAASPLAAKLKGQARIDSLLTEVPRAKEDTNKVKLLNNICASYYNASKEEALKYGEQAAELAQKLDWKKGLVYAYNMQGRIFMKRSDYHKAEEAYNKAMEINKGTGIKKDIASSQYNIGTVYSAQSNFVKALDYYFQALKTDEEIDSKADIANICGDIGTLYGAQANYDKSLEYFTKALNIFVVLNDKIGMAKNLGNIGTVYELQKNYAKSIEYELKALKINEETENRQWAEANLANIGNVYIEQKDFSTGLEYQLKALEICKEVGDRNALSICLGNIGENYLLMVSDTPFAKPGDYQVPISRSAILQKSISYLDSAIAIDKEIGNLDMLQLFSRDRYQAEEKLGNYKEALASYTQYTLYHDSVFSQENQSKIFKLETQRELELKDKQIEIDRLAVAKKRNERVFYIIGLGLLLVVIGVIFRNYKVQKKLNKLLSVEKKTVEEKTVELKHTNAELNTTLIDLKAAQSQLIKAEKQKENEIIRSRISQDIHDDISSELNKISWVSELAKAKAKGDNMADVGSLLDKITASSHETVNKLGEIIWTVNPKNDSLASLLSYMRNHISKFLADTPFHYTIHFPEKDIDVPINPELKRNLFLVMKEALNNVVKYSKAKNIEVFFKLDAGSFALSIADDGIGITENLIQGSGNGMGNMRKRMESVKGKFEIISFPGKGTQLIVSGLLS